MKKSHAKKNDSNTKHLFLKEHVIANHLKELDLFILDTKERINVSGHKYLSGLSIFGLYTPVAFTDRDYLETAQALRKEVYTRGDVSQFAIEHPAVVHHAKLKAIFHGLDRGLQKITAKQITSKHPRNG